jgi:hypothetical protein
MGSEASFKSPNGPGLLVRGWFSTISFVGALVQELFHRSRRQERCLVRGWLAVSAKRELLIRSYSSGQYGRSGVWSGAG